MTRPATTHRDDILATLAAIIAGALTGWIYAVRHG
jgi:hypothetical protein